MTGSAGQGAESPWGCSSCLPHCRPGRGFISQGVHRAGFGGALKISKCHLIKQHPEAAEPDPGTLYPFDTTLTAQLCFPADFFLIFKEFLNMSVQNLNTRFPLDEI